MTAKQYYKQTSDMAYPLTSFFVDEGNPERVVANIALVGKTRDDAVKILEENDFFSVSAEECGDDHALDTITELELRFHYGVDSVDCFLLDVCDVIDCTVVEGGKVVFSCETYDLIRSIRHKPSEEKKETETKDRAENGDGDVIPTGRATKSIFDLFDDLIGRSSCLGDLFNVPSFPKFPDISDMIEKTKKDIETNAEKMKQSKDGNTKFYHFSCTIDPDGKVRMSRSSNDGTVSKEFSLDNKDISSCRDVDKGCYKTKDADDPRVELRNLVK